jgi:hypothetical protein
LCFSITKIIRRYYGNPETSRRLQSWVPDSPEKIKKFKVEGWISDIFETESFLKSKIINYRRENSAVAFVENKGRNLPLLIYCDEIELNTYVTLLVFSF